MRVSKKTLVLPVMVFVGLAFSTVPLIGLTGCGSLFGPDCSAATSSLAECQDCVGIERLGGGTIKTPCENFSFAIDQTCECDRF